jgi:hypothetical protein
LKAEESSCDGLDTKSNDVHERETAREGSVEFQFPPHLKSRDNAELAVEKQTEIPDQIPGVDSDMWQSYFWVRETPVSSVVGQCLLLICLILTIVYFVIHQK